MHDMTSRQQTQWAVDALPCKHYWLLEMTTPTGTPARCKKCGKERVFRTKDQDASGRRTLSASRAARHRWGSPGSGVRPNIMPSRIRADEMPFHSRSGLRGTRI